MKLYASCPLCGCLVAAPGDALAPHPTNGPRLGRCEGSGLLRPVSVDAWLTEEIDHLRRWVARGGRGAVKLAALEKAAALRATKADAA